MDDVTEALPFTEKPGVLFVAPLGSDLPQHYVASDPPLSGNDPRFRDSWPSQWIRALPEYQATDPQVCDVRRSISTDCIQVGGPSSPIVSAVTTQEEAWTFGSTVAALLRDRLSHRDFRTGQKVAMPPEVRMMLGWESLDGRNRVIARQFILGQDGWFHLEQAYKPAPPTPRLRWWHRLPWVRKPVVEPPGLHPPFEVWQVGELAKPARR